MLESHLLYVDPRGKLTEENLPKPGQDVHEAQRQRLGTTDA